MEIDIREVLLEKLKQWLEILFKTVLASFSQSFHSVNDYCPNEICNKIANF